ncbi:hypothetical protein JW851_00285 [Candidatus Woesearchaeota archaeon]|nr:hypothetical protein [Candidatus Woesearchaeota archaeon]
MYNKRGQVTIFIVIGLILLLAVGITIYLYSVQEPRVIEQAELPRVQQVPIEAEPIRQYVRACIEETAKESLIKLGEHGGYIDTTGFAYNPIEPTEGTAVQFSKNSELIIPYWRHMDSPNTCFSNCQFDSKRPTIQQIKKQLETYMNQNIENCLGNFEAFPEYIFSKTKPPQTTVTIGQKNIVFYVEYPLHATKGTTTFEIPDYATNIDLNLKEIYDVSTKLVELESQYGYLEKYTGQLISVFSRLDEDALPPIAELDIGLGAGTIWTEPQIKEKLTGMLTSYIPLLQVPGTLNYKDRNAPQGTTDPELYRTLYNRNTAVLLDEEIKELHPELKINFNYLDWWDPYIDVCPGQVCQAETATSSMPMLGMVIGIQRYNFAYDLSFPILIELTNPYSFKGEGYTFKFFIEHNMRANQPMKTNYQRTQMLDISENTMLCKKEHWTSEEFTIKVNDGKTKQPVDEAQIAFNCGTESCNIGTTTNGEIKTKLPQCIGGMILVEKNEYHPANALADTSKKEEQTITITLEPYRLIDINTMKWLVKKTGQNAWSLDETGKAHPEKDEETLIMLERQTSDLEEAFRTSAQICGGLTKAKIPCGDPPRDNSKNIRMLPGKYKVKIFNFRYPQPAVIIPKDLRTFDAGPFADPKKVYIPSEDIVFDQKQPLPTGIAEFEWELTKDALDSTNEITFNYLYFALDKIPKSNRKIEDLEQIGKMQSYSTLYRKYLEPELI